MRILFLLLLWMQSITSVFASHSLSDKPDSITPAEPQQNEIDRRDFAKYVALAKPNANMQETEKFLKTKIKQGSTIDPIIRLEDKKTTGWTNLELDDSAVNEVRRHEGIAKVMSVPPFGNSRRSNDIGKRSASEAETSNSARTENMAGRPPSREAIENDKPPTEPEPKAPRTLDAEEQAPQNTQQNELIRRDFARYHALANKTADSHETEKFLKTKVQQGHTILTIEARDKKITGWANLILDDTAFKEVQSHEGIEYVKLEPKIKDFRALIPRKEARHGADTRDHTTEKDQPLSARDIGWKKQTRADKALVMDSQYQGANLNALTDFVHVSEPGKNSIVYILGRGVRVDAVNRNTEYEFHPSDGFPNHIQVLQTQPSIDANQEPHDDEDKKYGHDTAAASKAVGAQWGVAKSASFIPVKMLQSQADFHEAFQLIIQDLKNHPDRARRSVILIVSGSEDKYTLESARADDLVRDYFELPMEEILGLGVPIVCAAGNEALDSTRSNIDSVPAVFQDTDTPLINVGAADYNGNRVPKSQYGNQLTIYAPGDQVAAQSVEDLEESLNFGTSIAAPQVAGLIATYLSYDQKPWDDSKQGLERVKAIRDYLVSDRSSWERQAGIRMIWNGAGKPEHDSAVATRIPGSKALSIVLQRKVTSGPSTTGPLAILNEWLFFEGPRGQPAGCRPDKEAWRERIDSGERTIDNAPWPTVSMKLSKLDGMECEYKNNGQSPGALWCKERIKPIRCYEDQAKKNKSPLTCVQGSFGTERRATAYCEW